MKHTIFSNNFSKSLTFLSNNKIMLLLSKTSKTIERTLKHDFIYIALEMKKSKKLKILTNVSSNSNELNVFFKSSSNATTTIYKRLKKLTIFNTIMTTTTKNLTRLFDVFSKYLNLLQILKLKKSLTTFRKIFSITSLTNTTMKTQKTFLLTLKMCTTNWIEYARKN